ncbi:hypothetical protein GGI04_003698 [Coemansia thaxteri]|nr:hypothetical protein GGI04_003698 [Coemansia thaxteri]KAJ2479779.1 hypothetical protein EV174_003922 [Coemansia sp. RSA 2320]
MALLVSTTRFVPAHALLKRSLAGPAAGACRHASILGPEHRNHHHHHLRPAAAASPPLLRTPGASSHHSSHSGVVSTGGAAGLSQQQQHQQQVSLGGQGNSASGVRRVAFASAQLPPNQYIFRHRGAVPSDPQAINSLQFILNQKPLGATTMSPPGNTAAGAGAGAGGSPGVPRLLMLGGPATNAQAAMPPVLTAEDARERARLRLEELAEIVHNASGILSALAATAQKSLLTTTTTTSISQQQQESLVMPPLPLQPLASSPTCSPPNPASNSWLIAAASSVLGVGSAAALWMGGAITASPEFVATATAWLF